MAEPQVKHETVFDVNLQGVANAYAEALLNAAEKRNQAQSLLEELDSLVRDVCERDPLLDAFLTSSSIGREQKDVELEHAFQGRASDLLTDFLRILNEHDRLDLLRQIVQSYRSQFDARAGRIPVEVESAVPLSPEQVERVKQEVRRQFRKDPMVETRVVPELLGGLVVRVNDWVYDGSLRTRLTNIRNQLTETNGYGGSQG
jgi:F-type H+-transporting ATPase subunit delta